MMLMIFCKHNYSCSN